MTAIVKRGWCPDLYRPMELGDGFLVRLRPPLGWVSTAQALALAAAARRYRDGTVALTNRGNLQLRGFREIDLVPFADAMAACGLALAAPGAEHRRRVIVSPGRQAEAGPIERALLEDATLDGLPEKFAILIGSGCEADIVVRDDRVWIAGAARAAVCTPSSVIALAQAALRFGDLRMHALVRQVGEEAVYAAAALRAEAPLPPEDASGMGAIAPDRFAAAPVFGELAADALVAVARLGDAFAAGGVHVAPWRALAFTGVRDAAALRHALADAGLIVDPDDPRLRVTACVGQPRCARASVDVRGDAARLPPTRQSIHLSGCAKGCAHPRPAELTFVGRDGRYDLVRDGCAADTPAVRGVQVHELGAWLA